MEAVADSMAIAIMLIVASVDGCHLMVLQNNKKTKSERKQRTNADGSSRNVDVMSTVRVRSI